MVRNKPTQNAVAENTNNLLLMLGVELASMGSSSILCFIVWGLSFSHTQSGWVEGSNKASVTCLGGLSPPGGLFTYLG